MLDATNFQFGQSIQYSGLNEYKLLNLLSKAGTDIPSIILEFIMLHNNRL